MAMSSASIAKLASRWFGECRLSTVTPAESGHYVENKIIVTLGAIKSDIIRFGLGKES
jgi:hypothetical protein